MARKNLAQARRVKPARPGRRLRLFLPARSLKLQLLAGAVAVGITLSAQSFVSAREGSAYVVKPGDTLTSIANTSGVPLDQLTSLNKLSDPNMILSGQVLSLDSPVSSAPGSGSADYVVQPGDTLSGIAASHNISVQAIVQLDGLSDADQLVVGQHLKLPTPIPTPTARQAASNAQLSVQQRVLSEARRVGGTSVHVGVAAKNLVTGERVNVNASDVFPSASVLKLPLLVELERQATIGTVRWNDSLRSEVSAMISISDNTAANRIEDLVGDDQVNKTMGSLGLTNTQLVNHFSDVRGNTGHGQNETTPADMARLLELVATNKVVNPSVSADIRSLLATNTDQSKLVRLLPSSASVAHKSGWFDGVSNDVGIVTVDATGARWVVAVFSDGVPDMETGNQLVAVVSKALFDGWSGQ